MNKFKIIITNGEYGAITKRLTLSKMSEQHKELLRNDIDLATSAEFEYGFSVNFDIDEVLENATLNRIFQHHNKIELNLSTHEDIFQHLAKNIYVYSRSSIAIRFVGYGYSDLHTFNILQLNFPFTRNAEANDIIKMTSKNLREYMRFLGPKSFNNKEEADEYYKPMLAITEQHKSIFDLLKIRYEYERYDIEVRASNTLKTHFDEDAFKPILINFYKTEADTEVTNG